MFGGSQNRNVFATSNYGQPGQGGVGGPVAVSQDMSNQIVNTVKQDMETWQKSGQWAFSCYSVAKDCPSIPGLLDYSQEELRYEAYTCLKSSGNLNEYTNKITQLNQEFNNKRNLLANPDSNLRQVLVKLYNKQPIGDYTLGSGQGSIFSSNSTGGGGGLFGGNTGSTGMFGNSSAPATASGNSIFGGSNQTPQTAGGSLFGGSAVFGGSAAPNTAAVAPSIFGGSTTQTNNQSFGGGGGSSIFGGASSTGSGGGSIFGGGAAFGQPAAADTAAAPAAGTSIFSQPSGGGGLFSGSQATTAAAQPASSSIFGQPATAAAAGGFGAPATTATVSPFSSQTNTGGIFGGGSSGTFGSQAAASTPQSGIFGTAAASNTTPSTSSTITSGSSNIFGSSNSQGAAVPQNPFGTPTQGSMFTSTPQKASGDDIFSKPADGSGLFGQQDTSGGAGLFGKGGSGTVPTLSSSCIYSTLEELTQDEIEAYKSPAFTLYKLPVNPPSQEMCAPVQ